MSDQNKEFPEYLWGAAKIGEPFELTADQVYDLFESGYFGDAVTKVSHKRLLGFRSKIEQRFRGLADSATLKTSAPSNPRPIPLTETKASHRVDQREAGSLSRMRAAKGDRHDR